MPIRATDGSLEREVHMRHVAVFTTSVVALLLSVGAASPATQKRWVIADLGTLGGPEAGATAINERAQIVGWAATAADDSDRCGYHAFLTQKGKMLDLGVLPGGRQSAARGINDRGQVVGRSQVAVGKAMFHAFLWQKDTMLDLSSPGLWTAAQGMNERGQIVGSSKPSGWERAVLWTYKR